MKRLVLALAAAAAVVGPLAIATEASAQRRYDDGRYDRYDRNDRYDRYDDRRGDRRNDRWNDRWDRNDRWDDRRGGRNDRWDNRRDRWDDRRYNGYYLGNRWYYGQPPANYYNRYDYRPGYRAWQRGQYLPPAYRGYVVYDYNRYRLRPPPRGYNWVRHNNDYILAAIATGLILEVITGGY